MLRFLRRQNAAFACVFVCLCLAADGSIGVAIPSSIEGFVELLHSSDAATRVEAAEILGKMGPDAKGAVAPLIAALEDDDDRVAGAVATALGEIGPPAKEAIPALIRLFGKGDSQWWSAYATAVGRIGADAVRPLLEVIRDDNSDRVYWAMYAFHEMGPEGRDAVPELLRLVQEGPFRQRRMAAQTLRSVGVRGTVEATVLVEVCKSRNADPRDRVVEAIFEALVEMGADAVPAVIEAFDDDSQDVVALMSQVLVSIGPSASEAAPVLKMKLGNEKPSVRHWAARALAFVDPAAPESVPVLTESVGEDRDVLTRATAVEALGRTALHATTAVDALLVALRDPDKRIRDRAIVALEPMAKTSERVLVSLADLLNHDDHSVRLAVMPALVKSDSKVAEQAFDTLRACLGGEDREIRWRAFNACQRIGVGRQEIVEILMEYLVDPERRTRRSVAVLLADVPLAEAHLLSMLRQSLLRRDIPVADVRMNILDSLITMEPETVEGVAVLANALGAPGKHLRQRILQVLGKVGSPRGNAAVPAIVKCLSDSDYMVQAAAARALASYGRIDDSVIPKLIHGLGHEHSAVQIACAQSLGEIGAKASQAIPALRKGLEDDNVVVRTACGKSIRRIEASARAANPVP